MKKRVLNLYAGLGGNRKLWKNCHVTAVESNPKIAAVYKRLHPEDEVIIGDAHQFLKDNYKEFDFGWSSPPCQKHTKMMKFTRHDVADFPDLKLYEEIIFFQHFFRGGWCVENVVPYYDPLIEPTKRVGRHLFWSSLNLDHIQDIKRPKGFINKATVAGKKELMDWLGIHYEENIYYGKSHCPAQILRNCVHPDLGIQIWNEYLKAN